MAGKADIVDHLASNVEGLSKRQASDAYDAFVDCVTGALENGERVSLPGLGSLSVQERAARTGRNPATQETIQIPASKAVKFKIGKDLKDTLNS